jgi:hypothetical protein
MKPCPDTEGRINKANLTAGDSIDAVIVACCGSEAV